MQNILFSNIAGHAKNLERHKTHKECKHMCNVRACVRASSLDHCVQSRDHKTFVLHCTDSIDLIVTRPLVANYARTPD